MQSADLRKPRTDGGNKFPPGVDAFAPGHVIGKSKPRTNNGLSQPCMFPCQKGARNQLVGAELEYPALGMRRGGREEGKLLV